MILAEVVKVVQAKGKVVSIGEGRYLNDGTFIKADLKVGDFVVYNPHLIGHELEDEEGNKTILLSSNAVYGKYIK